MQSKIVREIDYNGKKYLSLKHAADLSGYHRDYIGQLIRRNEIQAEKIGFAWFIEENEWNRFLNLKNNISRGLEVRSVSDVWDKELLGKNASNFEFKIKLPKFALPKIPFSAVSFGLLGLLAVASIYAYPEKVLLTTDNIGKLAEMSIIKSVNIAENSLSKIKNATNLVYDDLPSLKLLEKRGNTYVLALSLPDFQPLISNIQLPSLPNITLPSLPFSLSDIAQSLGDIKNKFMGSLSSWMGDLRKIAYDFVYPPVFSLPPPAPPSPGVPSETPVATNEISKSEPLPQSDARRSPLGGLSASGADEASITSRVLSSLTSIIDSKINSRFASLNSQILDQITSSLSSVEKRLPPQIQNPVVFITTSIPGPYASSPPQVGSGVSASFGDFSSGISTGGNLVASGNVTLGNSGKSVSIASNSWSISDGGTATGFTALTVKNLTIGSGSDISGNAVFHNNVNVSGSLYASSTLQVTDTGIFYGNLGVGTTTPGAAFAVQGNILGSGILNLTGSGTSTITGPLTVGGIFTANSSSLIISSTSTVSNQFTVTRVPTQTHAFASWSPGVAGSNITDASLLINPSSAMADTNLFGLAVNSSPVFLVDADGDVFAKSVTLSGGATLATTTISGNMAIEGNTTLGDAPNNDSALINGLTTIYATSTGSALTIWNSNSGGNALDVKGGQGANPTDQFLVSSNGQAAFGTSTFSGLSQLTIGASTTAAIPLTLKGVTGQTANLFQILNSASSQLLTVDQNGNLGVGTTTPGTLLSIQSVGNLAPVTSTLFSSLTLPFITSTSTATSTFAGGISTSGLASSNGLTVTGGGVNLPAGTISNTELQNSSFVVTTASPLGGAATINLGDTLALTCATCVTNVTASGNIASSGGTTPNITFTGILPLANGGLNRDFTGQAGVITVSGGAFFASSSPLTVDFLNATSTTATSTFAGGLTVNGTGFVVNQGVPANSFNINASGNIGIGTTSPSTLFSIQSVGNFAPVTSTLFSSLTLPFITGTSTTATSTFSGYLSTSQFANTAMTAGSIPFFGAGGYMNQSNANLYYDSVNNRLGLGSTTPAKTLSVQGNALFSGDLSLANLTATGTLTFSGQGANMLAAFNNSNQLVSTSTPTLASLSATSTTATSTFAGGLTVNGTGFVVNQGVPANSFNINASGNVGIGTTGPATKLWVNAGTNLNLAVRTGSSLSGGLLGGIGISSSNDANSADQTMVISANPLVLSTNENERVRIDASGNVGIGTTTPGSNLSVVSGLSVGTNYGIAAPSNGAIIEGNVGIGTTGPGTKLEIQHTDQGVNGNLIIYTTDSVAINKGGTVGLGGQAAASDLVQFATISGHKENSTSGNRNGYFSVQTFTQGVGLGERMRIDSTGNVGIGTTDPSAQKLVVAGNVRVGTGTTGCVEDADGTLIAGTCSSDIRLKTDIASLSPMLDRLVQLRPVTYRWRADEFPKRQLGTSTQTGLIAQEVETLFPELIAKDDKGFEQITFQYLPLYLIQGLKELDLKVEPLLATTTASAISAGPFASASQALRDGISALGDMVVRAINSAIYSANGIFDKLFAKEVHTDKLCVSDSGGETCVTRSQLDSLLAGAAAAAAPAAPPAATSTPDITPPVITLLGNNPAVIQVGSAYSDPGAIVTDNVSSNLGYTISLDGATPADQSLLSLDTGTSTTHILTFFATDQAGNTASTTRTVEVVEMP